MSLVGSDVGSDKKGHQEARLMCVCQGLGGMAVEVVLRGCQVSRPRSCIIPLALGDLTLLLGHWALAFEPPTLCAAAFTQEGSSGIPQAQSLLLGVLWVQPLPPSRPSWCPPLMRLCPCPSPLLAQCPCQSPPQEVFPRHLCSHTVLGGACHLNNGNRNKLL